MFTYLVHIYSIRLVCFVAEWNPINLIYYAQRPLPRKPETRALSFVNLLTLQREILKYPNLSMNSTREIENASFVQTGLEPCYLVWVVWRGLEGVFGGRLMISNAYYQTLPHLFE